MRVALESTVLELDNAGVARAVRGLRDALAIRHDVEVLEVAHAARARGRAVRGVDRELRWFWLGLPRAVRRLRADVLHLPAAVGPWRAPAPLVVTVHDAMALEHPEWFSRANALQQRVAVRRLVRAARRVLVPSRHTAERLEAVAGLDRERVRVAPWGVDSRFAPGPVDEAVLRRPWHRRAVRAGHRHAAAAQGARRVARRRARARRRPPARGRRAPVAGATSSIADELRERAILAGRVDDDELVALLRGADVLVHAARHEGFGFPPLEAMACGTPVVAFRSTSIPEVVGDAAELAEPAPGALADALTRVLADPARRAELRERGLARAAEFTWERCADVTVATYREAIDG